MAGSRRNKQQPLDGTNANTLCRRVGLPPLTVEEQAALMSAIFACSPDGMAFFDQKLIIRAANESFAEQIRVPLEEIVGHPADTVMVGWWDQVGHIYREVRDTGNRFRAEAHPYVFKDQPGRGITYWDASVSPVYGADGAFLGYLLLRREVTERKQAEEEMSRLAAIVASSEDAIIGATLDGVVVNWNPGAETLYGYSAGEITGKSLEVLIPPNRSSELGQILSKVKQGRSVEHFETVRVRKDGRRIDVLLTVSPIKDRVGNVTGISWISHDITQPKRAEEAAARLAAIVESSDVAIIGKTLEGIITSWNSGAQRLYGYSASEVIGKPITILFPPEQAGLVKDVMDRLKRGERIEQFDAARVRKDGQRIDVSVTISPVRDSAGRVIGASTVARDITARKRGEEELARLNRYVRLLLDSTDEGIYGIDLQARCTLVNRSGAKMVGYEPEELLGKNVHQLFHHSHPDGSPYPVDECPIVRAIRVGEGVRVDSDVFWRKDGSSFPVEYSSYPIVEDGVVKGAVVSFMDITERKRMEEALLESEERLQDILDNTTAVIYLKDIKGRYILINRQYETLFHVTRKEIVGKTDYDIFPKEMADAFRANDQKVLEAGTPMEFDELVPHDDGIHTYISIKFPMYDSAHVVYGVCGVSSDITHRKQMEDELRKAHDQLELRVHERTAEFTRANEQLRKVNQELLVANIQAQEQAEVAWRRASELEATIQNIADGVFLFDKTGQIIGVNKAGLELIGLRKREEALRRLADYLALLNLRNAEGRPLAPEELGAARALRGEIVVGYEEIAKSLQTGRDIYLLVSAAPIRDREGNITGAVEVMSDITRIRELDKLKDEFISVAAHELKTPVAIMKGYAQALLRSTVELPPPQRKMLDSINRGADRIDRIVKDLLDITRLHIGQLELDRESINLPELAEDVVNRMALTTTKHRVRVVKIEPVVIHGDRDRLEQVLINLLENAIKYSPKGGDIDVAVDVRDGEAVVSVRDYGVGIPKEKQDHIFERFFSAHTGTPYDFGGMGVGLYISNEIITRHGGRMWFESEEGKGSTFFFALPLE